MSKRIFLPDHYRRATNPGQMIHPGEYDIDDPALFGLGGYLVKTGHATVIGSFPDTASVVEAPVVAAESVAPTPPQDATPPVEPSADTAWTFDPQAATVGDLEIMLVSHGVDLTAIEGTGKDGNVVKADLIAAYEAQVASPPEDDEEA